MVNPDPEALAWCKVSERFIFLDIARDRYFALADGAQHVFLERLGIEAAVSWHQPPPMPPVKQLKARPGFSEDSHQGAYSSRSVFPMILVTDLSGWPMWPQLSGRSAGSNTALRGHHSRRSSLNFATWPSNARRTIP